jgi:hypothetical protein
MRGFVVGREAFHGLIGETVQAVETETEADPAGLLLALLIAFGNSIGPRPHVLLGSRKHHA